jgi:lysophospholipase L1-like esterase
MTKRGASALAIFAFLVCAPGIGRSETIHLKIMPLGDSITWGTPAPAYGGYRHLLGTLLANDGYSVEFVGSGQSGIGVLPSPNNEGHPGWTIRRILKGIDSAGWLETYQPDIVLLHIGTNDLRPLVGGAAAAPDNLSALLDDILRRLPRAYVIVAQIIPFRPGPDPGHQAYNAAIPGIVASKGARVSVVDMQSILSPSDYADGLHPKAVGYDKMARAWEPAIRAAASAPSAPRGDTVALAPVPYLQIYQGDISVRERPSGRTGDAPRDQQAALVSLGA